MSQFSAWLPSRRQLQRHVARLVDSLESLLQRLRESIARTIGEAVANAVHEVTQPLGPLRAADPGAVRLGRARIVGRRSALLRMGRRPGLRQGPLPR